MRRRSKASGFKETARALRELATLIDRPIGEAQRETLRPVLRSAKSNLKSNGSYRTGQLFRLMRIRNKKVKRGHKRTVVGPTGIGIRYAHLVEFGTEAHFQPRRGIIHPGARPFPFLTPAYEEHRSSIVREFGRRVGPAIERQTKRLALKHRSLKARTRSR